MQISLAPSAAVDKLFLPSGTGPSCFWFLPGRRHLTCFFTYRLKFLISIPLCSGEDGSIYKDSFTEGRIRSLAAVQEGVAGLVGFGFIMRLKGLKGTKGVNDSA